MAHIKVYIFCQSEVGSGHYVRCNNIRKGLKDCKFEYITGAFTDDERKTIFAKQLKIINDYKPDIILLDGFPFMRYEWFDSGMEFLLKSVKNNWKDVKIVSSVRDICYPWKNISKKRGTDYYSALTTNWANEYFDAILVHGDKNFIKLDESFEHLNLIDPPVYYTGYVTDTYKPKPQERNGTVVSAGGGRVAMDCFDKAMELYDGTDWTFSVGPNHPKEHQKKLKRKIHVLTAGAPPPSIIFEKMQNLGFDVMHVYGLTETYGHMLQCAWNDEWNDLEQDKKNEIKARQGVRYPNTEGAVVMDPETMKPVPHDGKTMGEIMIRGNIVMKGYYKDKEATEKAMKGGWFHSGDLGVTHPNGYIKIQDRSKDIIISGGENISSIEIENTIAKHPAVSLAAVVAKPDEKWGETPCAFVELIEGKSATEEEIIKFCRETLAGFKLPKKVVFSSLPKTSTGKIQKF